MAPFTQRMAGLAGLLFAASAFAAEPSPPSTEAPSEPPPSEVPGSLPASETPDAAEAAPSTAEPAESTTTLSTPELRPPPPPGPALVSPRTAPEAPVVDTRPEPWSDDGSLGDNQRHFGFYAGLRSLFVLDDAFEPYAERSLLPSLSVGGSSTLLADGALSLALGGSWEVGGTSSRVRGNDTGLTLHRFTLVPELRHNFGRRFVAFGRVGVGAAYLRATLQDLAGGVERSADATLFTLDPGVGLAVQLGSTRRSTQAAPRIWLALDGGYLWSGSADLAFTADGTPARSVPIRFDALQIQGPYARLMAVLTF